MDAGSPVLLFHLLLPSFLFFPVKGEMSVNDKLLVQLASSPAVGNNHWGACIKEEEEEESTRGPSAVAELAAASGGREPIRARP